MTTSRREQSPGGQAGPAPMTAEGARAEGSGMSLAGEAPPQPRSRPSRRALLTAGGVTAGGVALGMAGGMARTPSADAQTTPVAQGAQVISVNDAAYGATGNGWTDDSTAIQNALNATPAGGRCLIPAPPTFTFTANDASPCKFTASGTAYTAGMIVTLSGTSLPTTSPPGLFTAGTQYYVVNPSGTTFELSATSGGSGIGSTSMGSGGVSAYYLIEKTLQIPNGVSVEGPAVAQPAKYRSAAVPTPPLIRVAANAGLSAVITDTAWTSSSATPSPSSGILINGVVVDGNAAGGGTSNTNKAGHGIVLMGAANSIVNCGVQNAAGSGIVLAVLSLAGNNVSSNLVENGIYGCRVFQSGNYGIWVQHYTSGSTSIGISDGYLYDSVVDQNCQTFTGSTASYEGIHMDSCGDWKVCHNHVYATLGGAYYFGGASGYYIEGNRTDNFGYQGGSTTYYGYNVVPGLPGGAFTNNQTNQTLAPLADGTWTHFSIQGGATAMPVYFANNLVQQTVSSGTDSSSGYTFAGGSGGLTVKGVDGPFFVPSGVGLTSVPVVSGSVSFVDFRPLVVTNSYAPATVTSLTATSTSFTAISSANVNTGAFTVGPQGTAIITVSLVAEWSNAAGAAFNVALHGTTTPAANAVVFKDSSATIPRAYQMQFVVTGLTPFTSYNFDLIACMTSGDTLTVLALGTTSSSPTLTSQGAPVTMTVQAL
jgi:hypothetical protein